MSPDDKPLVWLQTEVKTPPFSHEARCEAGYLLRRLQQRERLTMPESRTMPSIGPRVHELRITDAADKHEWRIIYRLDADAIVVVDIFEKTSRKTPKAVIDRCRRRLRDYDES